MGKKKRERSYEPDLYEPTHRSHLWKGGVPYWIGFDQPKARRKTPSRHSISAGRGSNSELRGNGTKRRGDPGDHTPNNSEAEKKKGNYGLRGKNGSVAATKENALSTGGGEPNRKSLYLHSWATGRGEEGGQSVSRKDTNQASNTIEKEVLQNAEEQAVERESKVLGGAGVGTEGTKVRQLS